MKIPTCLLVFAMVLPSQSLADPAKDDLENLPFVYKYRCTEESRLKIITKCGGDPASEDAVVKALHFLRNKQNPDGSWTEQKPVGMTGLALLCFLGHGETAQSDQFGVYVLNAIQYLVDVAVKNGGKLGSDFKDKHWTYEHAIATHALVEAYAICQKGFGEEIPKLKEMVESSGKFIIQNQHQGGGWDYDYSKDSARGGDVSQSSWHLLALRSCQLTDLEFSGIDVAYKNGLAYIENCQMPSGAIGYSSPHMHGGSDGTTLTASGAYCAQQRGKGDQKILRRAIPYLVKHMKFGWDTVDADLYGHFFASMALLNHGGKPWSSYQKVVMPQFIKNQNEDGSFKQVGGGDRINAVAPSFAGDSDFSTIYRTCLATLILESYYRRIPVLTK